MSTRPLLKWPGGKAWLAPALAPLLRTYLQGTYYEPFLGGGAVFLELGPHEAVLSDSNGELMDAVSTIAQNPAGVLERVWRLSNTPECYYRVRISKPRSELTSAARFLYLNRTAWGGIYRVNRRGEFNVPFGASGRSLVSKERIFGFAEALKGRRLETSDFEPILRTAEIGDVIYADPPYTTKGANNGFLRYNESLFSWADQERLARVLYTCAEEGATVALSCLFGTEVTDLYQGWTALLAPRVTRVSRTLTGRRPVIEAVLTNQPPDAFTKWPWDVVTV